MPRSSPPPTPRTARIGTLALVAACLAATGAQPPASPRPAGMDRFLDALLARMTVEEKLGQLNQPGGPDNSTGPAGQTAADADIRAGRIGSLLSVSGASYTRRLQHLAVHESRLGIPLLIAYDVIHGFRTIFPVPIAEAASWDPAVVERSARISAVEATAHGIHWTYAPMVDIARDPRWGRVVEGSGEDPFLGSAMAAAKVRGFQGADLGADSTLLATAKHFVGYGAAEGGRDYNTAELSERTLAEVYLPPFRAAVKAGARSVMAGFNEIAGVPMHANGHLIRDVLRREWGFDGILVSDYTGVRELIQHGTAADSAAAGASGIRAGVDVDMVSTIYLTKLSRLLKEGVVPESLVDQAARRVLEAKYRLGLFDNPYRYSDTLRERARTLTPEHLAAARDAARRSIVLLKNRGGTLPLSKRLQSIAVVGPLADDAASALGPWAGAGRPEDAVSVLEGIRRAVRPGTRVLYARGATVTGSDTTGFAEAVRVSRRADAVVLVIGESRDMSGEAHSRATLDLPGVQERLAERLWRTGKPLVVVLMNGRPLSTPWLEEHVPAVLETWFLGVQMGPAVADVLFGDFNPGGKLPMTVPRTVGQIPIYYNHKPTGRPPDARDMYTSKYLDTPWTPLYPFGYGLSYTTFRYSGVRLGAGRVRRTDSLSVSVTVTNTGRRTGDEVVQLYLRDEVASFTPPVRTLRGFRRINLAPGESRTVTFTLGSADFALPGPDLRPMIEPGFFTVGVGTNSTQLQEARFEVVE